MQQSLPGLKRDGSTVLSSVSSELLYADNSTSRANGVLIQSDFIRSLAEKIHSSPEVVTQQFEAIRKNSESLPYSLSEHPTSLTSRQLLTLQG